MPLFRNTFPFLLPSAGFASILLLFSSSAADAAFKNGVLSESLLNCTPNGQYSAPDYDLGHGSLDDVTLTLNYGGKSFTIFDANNPSADLVNVTLHLSIGSITGNVAGAWEFENGHVNFTFAMNPDSENSLQLGEERFLRSIPSGQLSSKITINYIGDNGGNGNNNNGGGSPTGGGGDNGNGGNGNNGGGDPNGGGMPATPEPSAIYLSVVAAGLMSVMLLRRGLRVPKASAPRIPA